MQGRGDYRIRNTKKTEDDIDFEMDEHLKVSSHIHSQKRESHVGLHRKHRQQSQNSRLKESRTNSGFGSIAGSRVARVLRRSKNQQDKNVVTDIEFNNVRWISIVSAYDSKRLRHVTVSKQSCESFLKKYGNGLRKDPAAMAYFKDIKKHFHSWLTKINQTFVKVLNHFLSGTDKSPLSELEKVNPILEEIRTDTAMMKEKLEGCLKHYQSSDFRKMAEKYKGFFSFSSQLEELICIIFEKKEKIDLLFYELERGGDVDRNLQKIRKEGIKETKKLIYNDQQHYDANLCEKIMDKVGKAINEMASKGLNVFHKLQGAKDLISKIKKILKDTSRTLTIKEIKKFSQIFQQILEETNRFESFVEQFDSESDFVTPELRQKIHQCRQDLVEKKRMVGQMQAIFVGTVISETIEILSRSHSLNKAFNLHNSQYHEHNHLLEAIADAMLDQTKRTITQGLVKQNRVTFSRIEEDINKIQGNLKRHREGFIIDTQDGQVASMECSKISKNYKDRVKNLIKKNEDALRQLDARFSPVRLPVHEKDTELLFLNQLVSTSQIVNSRERHKKIHQEKAFHELKEGILVSASELSHTESILKQFEEDRITIKELNEKNPLKELIKQIRTENGLYGECHFLLNMIHINTQTSERNIIESIGKVNDQNRKKRSQLQKSEYYRQTKAYRHVLDRIYCQTIVKGLKRSAVQQIDNTKMLNFPQNDFEQKQMENQVKYRSLLAQNLNQEAYLVKQKLKNAISIMKDLISARSIIQKLKFNENGQYIALTGVLSGFTSQMFKNCVIKSKHEGLSTDTRKIVLEVTKNLRNKSMNIDILEGQLQIQNNQALLRVRKQFIHFKDINQNAIKSCEELSRTQDNQPLDTLSKLTHIIAEYLHLTKQSVYLALNEWRQPIWIGQAEQAKNGLCSQIDLNGYPRGTFVDAYTHEAPKAFDEKKKKPTKTVSPMKSSSSKELQPKGSSKMIVKQKSHPKESMDEQIAALQSDVEMEMEENYEDVAEEEMGEDIEEMEQNYEDDMEEEIGDEMGDDVEEEAMEQAMEEDMAEDIQFQEIKMKPPPKLKEQPKKEEPKKQEPKPVKKQVLKPVYEIIPFFRELENIYELIEKINLSQKTFWQENVDFQQVEDYYHREEDLKDRNNFIKSLENCFSMFMGSRFGAKLGQIVKNLDKFKKMKGLFLSLGEKNWNNLFKILAIIQRNYSIIINSRGQVLHLFTYNGDSRQFRRQSCKKCIYDYLDRTFKTPYFSSQNFDFEGYISSCFKTDIEELINSDDVSFHYVVKYNAKSIDSLPDANSNLKLKELKEIQIDFDQNLLTGLNVFNTCLQFWVKAVDSNSQDCYKPDYQVLDGYLKKLNAIEKKQSIFHYLTELRESMMSLKANIKTHKNKYDNLLFKVDSSNVLQCIQELGSLYSKGMLQKKILEGEKKKVYFISRQEESEMIKRTAPALLFTNLLELIPGNKITGQDMVENVQYSVKKQNIDSQSLGYLMQFLNILEIEHYFINKPDFLFKNNMEKLVLSIIQPLGITKIDEFDYDDLFKDLFKVNKKAYSTELTLNKHIDHKLLTKQFLKEKEKTLKDIDSGLNKSFEKFKSTIKQIDMSSVLSDHLLGNVSKNQLIKTISDYQEELNQYSRTMHTSIKNKEENLLIYVHSYRTTSEKVLAQIDQKSNEISSLLIKQPKNKDIDSLLTNIDLLFSELRTWAKAIGLAKECTCYILVSDDSNYIINMEFSQYSNQRQKSKEYLEKLISRNWLSDKSWISTWNHIYEKYIDKQIKIEIGAGGISCIYYTLRSAVKKIMEDARIDLAEKADVIDFVRNYNKYKFTHCNQALENMNKCYSQIHQKLVLKRELISLKKIVKNNNFEGVRNIAIVSSLFSCLTEELDVDEQELEDIIGKTSAVKGKEVNLQKLSSWFKQLGQKKCECQFYELYTSKEVPITILPVNKIEKDRTKNKEQIDNLLKDIKLLSPFTVKLVQGIQRVYLESESVQCVIRDEDEYLKSSDQLKNFEPEIAEGEMLLLVIQQESKEPMPLWISELVLEVKVELPISEERTVGRLNCGVWRIGKDDYENIKYQDIQSKDEENRAIHKKLRGLASPEDKTKEVCVGQKVFLDTVGNWLKDEVKRYENIVEEKKKAEMEKQRQLEMQRKDEENFLEAIEEELRRQNIPVNPVLHSELEIQKNTLNTYKTIVLKGYFKEIADKTHKIIEKLGENKSVEETGRLDPFVKAYTRALEKKLFENIKIEEKIRDGAEVEFAKVIEEREKAKKEKKDTQQQNTLNITQSMPPSTGQEEKPDIDEDIVFAGEVDIIDLIAQRKDITDSKVQQFLLEWLQAEELKDPDYLGCLLTQFCKLEKKDQKSLVQLR